jgi:hypothetical protein
MDEIFGYFPPTANPPSKTPLLTLMKQARAFGLGVVLATQNPVDLDYKGLSNAGTWFLGRLQTERDKARVMEGLEGASAAAGAAFDRQKLEATLAALGNRVFLMNNVHDDEPVVFQTRWALSYLRGPLTRGQIETLMAERKGQTATSDAGAMQMATAIAAGARPVLPPEVPEVFLARRKALKTGETFIYRPALLGTARVHFASATAGVDAWQDVALVVDGEDLGENAWEAAEVLAEPPELDDGPDVAGKFADLPGELAQAKSYKDWTAALKDHLYRTQVLTLFRHKALKQTSQAGESEGEFRARLAQSARELRDAQTEKLRAKYGPKLATLKEQIRKAEQRVEKEKSQATQSTFQATITFASSVLSAFTGRKLASSANIGRAATAMKSASRVARERADIGHAEETVEAIQQRYVDLQAEFEGEVDSIETNLAADRLELETLEIKPRKSNINVTRVALAWML